MTDTATICTSSKSWDDSHEQSASHMKNTLSIYCQPAKWVIKCEHGGVEVHGGNGYLPKGLLNKHTDE
jgi:2,4-dienoyl-CoA reductase-like NADH-dependent reductase (Old Yellow Enzyme family)